MLGAAAIDLLIRLSGVASFHQVLWVEAFLFPLTGLALYLLFRSHPRLSGLKGGLQVVLIWAFFLAGLRSGI